MSATNISPGLPVVTPTPWPTVWASIDVARTSNPAMADEFERSGPYGVLRTFGYPAIQAGCERVVIRRIVANPLKWMESFREMAEMFGIFVTFYLDLNGVKTQWGLRELAKHLHCVIADASAGYGAAKDANTWKREYLWYCYSLVAVEPAIDRNDPWAQQYCCVVADNEWNANYGEGAAGKVWKATHQIPPWECVGGCIRWLFGSPEEVTAKYQSLRVPWCKGVIAGADLFSHAGLTVAKMRGEA